MEFTKRNKYRIQFFRTFTAAVLVICMAISILGSCAVLAEEKTIGEALAEIFGISLNNDQIRFSEMEYIRPDIQQLRNDIDELSEALNEGAKYKTVEKILDRIYEEWYSYSTMNTLADIHNCIDITDEYWSTEYEWCNDNYYEFYNLMEDMYYVCASSEMAETLEKRYFWRGFVDEYSEKGESFYSPEMIELKQQENSLISEYRSVLVSPTIDVGNGEEDYYNLLLTADTDEAYYYAMDCYYDKYNPIAAEIYIKLIEVRKKLAEAYGYDSYEQMQYEYFFERDYSSQDANRFIDDVAEYMVPLYVQLVDQGIYDTLSYIYVGESELYNVLDKFTRQMGGQIREAFEFMSNGELYDISFSNVKANMSFQEYISGYESPFLFMDPEESLTDILSFAHEFGHYTEAYVNQNAYATTDLSEIYSQSMEYLLLSHLQDIMSGRKSRMIKQMKLVDTVETYIYQTSFAEFERQIYELSDEELSVDTINAISLEMARKYGYLEPGRENYYAKSWIDIAHFFEYPFYVISYPVSNEIALQIYRMETEESGKGEEKFMELMDRVSSSMMETAVRAGLESPFRESGVSDTAVFLKKQFGVD